MSGRRTAPQAHPDYREDLLNHQGRPTAAARARLEAARRERRREQQRAVAVAALADPTSSPAERYLARAVVDLLGES